ncbi:polymorphic toxin-type HINT domain-containing protein [Paenibacillus terrigena]|uniref:polymorphic toxin-type HINT domain-containing protein n=1 Tax=Paenibacillus terrigena TaxID=369333 RepID=UPI000377E98C|nr:polymorphic toxin-type HINT domain-containing protein [Paenibacillus terrigena]
MKLIRKIVVLLLILTLNIELIGYNLGQVSANEEISQITIESILDRFSVTEEFIQEQLDAGHNLSDIYKILYHAERMNISYEEALKKLFATEMNRSQSVTGEVYEMDTSQGVPGQVYGDINNSILQKMSFIESSSATVTGQVYDEKNHSSNNESSVTDEVYVGQMTRMNFLGVTPPPVLEKAPVYQKDSFSQAPYAIGNNNESISSMTGELSLQNTEIKLPGRNGLGFSLTRQYSTRDAQFYDMDYREESFPYDIYKYYVEYSAVAKTLIPQYTVKYNEVKYIQDDMNNDGIVDSSSSPVYETYERTVGVYNIKDQAIKAANEPVLYHYPAVSEYDHKEKLEKSTDSFPDYINYDKNQFVGRLYKDGGSKIISGSYTPAHSKTEPGSCTNRIPGKYDSKGVWSRTGSGNTCPDSLQYTNGGYSGTLNRTTTDIVKACSSPDLKSAGYVCTKEYKANYSGTVTKPASPDTRTWRQGYIGTITKPGYSTDTRYDNWISYGSNKGSWRFAYTNQKPFIVESKIEQTGPGVNVQLNSEASYDYNEISNLKNFIMNNQGARLGVQDSKVYYISSNPNPVIKGYVAYTGYGYTYSNTTKTPQFEKIAPIGKGWRWKLPYMESEKGKQYINMMDGGRYQIEGTKLKGYEWESPTLTIDSTLNVNGEQSNYVLTSIDSRLKQWFTSDGRLIQISDPYNNKIHFLYEQSSTYNSKLLTQIKDSIGNTIRIAYTPSQVIVTNGKQTITYTKRIVDGVEFLDSVTDAEGRKTTYYYLKANARFNLLGAYPERAANNPYALITKIQHPTGATTLYDYEKSPQKNYMGSESYNEVYRISSRWDEVSYTNGSVLPYNRQSMNYNNSFFGSSYDQDMSFSTTIDDGLIQNTFKYRKDYIDNNTASQFYLDNTEVKAGSTIKTTEYSYNKKVGSRSYNSTSPTSVTTSDNLTSDKLTVTTEYDDHGNVTRRVDSNGAVSTFNYDSGNHLLANSLEQVDTNQFIYTEMIRNIAGDVTRTTVKKNNASGELLQQVNNNSIDTYGNVTSRSIVNGSQTITVNTEYNSASASAFPTKQSVMVSNAEGTKSLVSLENEYESLTGLVTGMIDGKGSRTSYQYDNLGRIRQVTYPAGESIKAEYDDKLNTTTVTNEVGSKSQTRWNALGWKTEEGIFKGSSYEKKAKYNYDAFGRVISTEDALSNLTQNRYDAWGRIQSTVNAEGSESRFQYLDSTRQKSSTDAEGNMVIETYDKFGRLDRIDEKTSGSTTSTQEAKYVYNPITGKLIEELDAKQQSTKYGYDILGQLTAVTNAKNEVTRYSYDMMGNLQKTQFPDGKLKTKEYDELGRVIRIIDETNQAERKYYDANDNLVKRIDRNGKQVTFDYDKRNRLVSRISSDDETSYSYDAGGKRISMTDGTGVTSYKYDPETEQLLTKTYPDGLQLSMTYDTNGNRIQMTDPFGKNIYYAYDNMNRLKSVGNMETKTDVQYSYYLNGLLKETNTSTGLISKNQYDGKSLVRLSESLNNNSINNYEYKYDSNKNIVYQSQTGQAKSFTYDVLNRIESLSYDMKYTYDLRGNRSELKSSNEVLSLASVENAFDSTDRLTSVKIDGKLVQYRYDGDDLLVERIENGITTRYYYDGQQIIAEATVVNGRPQLKAHYVRGNKLESIEYANGSRAFVLTNGHGDIVELRDEAGNILNQYSYDIWGKPINQTEQVHNPFRYSGELWDDTTQLQYLRARWYDPSIGRFINEDTYEGEQNNPLSLNLYTYVSNNPLIYFDPSGHFLILSSGVGGDSGYYLDKNNIRRMKSNSEIDYSFYMYQYQFDHKSFMTANNKGNIKYKQAMGDVVLKYDVENIDTIILGIALVEGVTSIKSGSNSLKRQNECQCFIAGTKVMTDEGEKPIEEIEVGDKVLAKDDDTGEIAYKEVEWLFHRDVEETYNITVGGEVITTTDEHPFWIVGKDWVKSKDLVVGDVLTTSDGKELAIEKIEVKKEHRTVYNFKVKDFHTYFVSNLGIWTHNACSTPNTTTKWDIKTGADKKIDYKFNGSTVSAYRDPKTGMWWAKDTTGHADSAFKVFKEAKGGKELNWVSDADEYGNFIVGKHKSSTGTVIKIK